MPITMDRVGARLVPRLGRQGPAAPPPPERRAPPHRPRTWLALPAPLRTWLALALLWRSGRAVRTAYGAASGPGRIPAAIRVRLCLPIIAAALAALAGLPGPVGAA